MLDSNQSVLLKLKARECFLSPFRHLSLRDESSCVHDALLRDVHALLHVLPHGAFSLLPCALLHLVVVG